MFDNALKILYEMEFSSPSNALHFNKGEESYTFMGIYKKAHPNWKGWKYMLPVTKQSIKELSKYYYKDTKLQSLVKKFYKEQFWDKMKLDEVTSSKIATEMFLFGVNVGIKQAVKTAQRVVKVKADGIVGRKTLTALNNYDEDIFSEKFDELEINFYENLVITKPHLKRYLNGWINRAKRV